MRAPEWPRRLISPEDQESLWEAMKAPFTTAMASHRLSAEALFNLGATAIGITVWLRQKSTTPPFFLGINGPQGSGKTTLAAALRFFLEHLEGFRVAVISLDDLYKTRAQRAEMAAIIHPLFVTRGVPGSHDVGLGLRTFEHLRTAKADSETPLPQFDKSLDDRSPEAVWPVFQGRPDIVLFEGWFVGALPQSPEALNLPVNDLEAQEDPDGRWRRYANDALANDYQALFQQLGALIVLRIPLFEKVFEWRSEQEQKLRDVTHQDSQGIMNEPSIHRFIKHFERLTRHNQQHLPDRADMVLELDAHHCITHITLNRPG